jgi:hypothetical protein
LLTKREATCWWFLSQLVDRSVSNDSIKASCRTQFYVISFTFFLLYPENFRLYSRLIFFSSHFNEIKKKNCLPFVRKHNALVCLYFLFLFFVYASRFVLFTFHFPPTFSLFYVICILNAYQQNWIKNLFHCERFSSPGAKNA